MQVFAKLVVSGLIVTGMSLGAGIGRAQSADATLYVGLKSCGMCHKKDDTGNQLAKWQSGPHAKAFATLGTPEAKAAGAKVGVTDPQTSGKCLKCHSTAYNWTETVATDKLTPEDGVTCESCHGPGKNYKSKAIMESRDESVKNGMVYPATKSCLLCHNDKSPSWNPARYTAKDGKKVGFDLEQAVKKIEHPNPAAKK